MQSASLWTAALILAGCATATAQAQEQCCVTMQDLRHMTPCQLEALFRQAEVGTPLVGNGRGRLLVSTDPRHPRIKVLCSNLIWKGKVAEPDGHFTNRWLGGIRAIESQYAIGPSWIDGRPAVIMEYAPGTALLANTHDELRQVGPGLYLGPLYDRCPCPVLRGYLAVEVGCCGH
jgi:hypothetical protein